MIQVAASMVHYREKNLIGAQGLLNKAKEKFKRCRDQNIVTNLVERFLDWKELEDLVFSVPNENSQLSDYQKIFGFRFKNYPY